MFVIEGYRTCIKLALKSVTSAEIYKGSRKPCSPTVRHITETGYRIDMNKAFKMLYGDSQERVLGLIETLAIRKFKPLHCVYRNHLL